MSYLLQGYLPSGSAFNGEIVYPMAEFVIPYSYRNHIATMDIQHNQKFVTKHTGFDPVRHRMQNSSTAGNEIAITIGLGGNLPRYVLDVFMRFLTGINGSGLDVKFYDDLATDRIYYGKIINSIDYADVNILHGSGVVELNCYEYEDIV